jgi:hypothetical protein
LSALVRGWRRPEMAGCPALATSCATVGPVSDGFAVRFSPLWRCSMPKYFFDVRSNKWDYTDPDGIELSNDGAAFAYAQRMIMELKDDQGDKYAAGDLRMLVRKENGTVRFSVPFNLMKE